MASISDELAWIVQAARANYERVAPSEDITPGIYIIRGGQVDVMIFAHQIDSTDIRALACMAIRMLDADAIGLCLPSHISTSPLNPRTGQPWQDGEQQELAGQHNGIADGHVQECVLCLVANRAGDITGASIPVHRSPNSVATSEPHLFPDGASIGGRFADDLIGAMEAPSIGTVMARDGILPSRFNLSQDAVRAKIDGLFAKFVVDHNLGTVGFRMGRGDEYDSVLQQLMEDAGNVTVVKDV